MLEIGDTRMNQKNRTKMPADSYCESDHKRSWLMFNHPRKEEYISISTVKNGHLASDRALFLISLVVIKKN